MTDHLITLDCGPINGKREIVDGFSVDYFLGVPFAKPPIGELRFEVSKFINSIDFDMLVYNIIFYFLIPNLMPTIFSSFCLIRY